MRKPFPTNHFTVTQLLQCGIVYDHRTNLSREQRRELNQRTKTGELVKKRVPWRGGKTRMVWRVVNGSRSVRSGAWSQR